MDGLSGLLENAARAMSRGEAHGALTALYDKTSGEPFERLTAVLELAGEWARAAGVEAGGETWAEAWSALEALRAEAEDLDMDARHALARAVAILDRAAAQRTR